MAQNTATEGKQMDPVEAVGQVPSNAQLGDGGGGSTMHTVWYVGAATESALHV